MTGTDDRDQAATIALLADPATHGGAVVERVDTHISHLFLAGDRVYKLKRAVRFPYLDFSTRAARGAACAAEAEVNRRTAPGLYLGVAPVLRDRGGALRLGAPGEEPAGDEVLDSAVVMRRFDQDTLFDSMAARGALTPALVASLAETVADFHRRAAPAPGFGGTRGMALALDGIAAELRRFAPAVFPRDETGSLIGALREAHAAQGELLERRAAAGFVRHGHGDLHLRNICLIEGRPTPFDAIEFSDEIAKVDVLYDLAFLLMDLEHRRLRSLANLAFNHYLWRTEDYAGLAVLPLFLACRAAIRAHVTATQAEGVPGHEEREALAAEARRYLALGREFLEPVAPRLIAVGGLSGTGKTVLARRLAPLVGVAPGAAHLRSDVIRKTLMGVDPLTRLGDEGYTAATTERTYATLCARAAMVLAGNHAVVADAVYARRDERDAIAAVAREAGVPFDGLWLESAEAVRVDRVRGRTGDASDADASIARAQTAVAGGGRGWCRIDAGGAPASTEAKARKALNINEKSPTLER